MRGSGESWMGEAFGWPGEARGWMEEAQGQAGEDLLHQQELHIMHCNKRSSRFTKLVSLVDG